MSRIGKKHINIPQGVMIDVKDNALNAKGSKGELSITLSDRVIVRIEEDNLIVEPKDKELDKAIWGTMRAIIANTIIGVSQGWSKALELYGVGFRMNVQGKKLNMRLGFSHEIDYDLPEGIEATVENNVLTISGIDRQLVGQVASEIRAFKKPEPYKGKGFRYVGEQVRRKAGKAAKTE